MMRPQCSESGRNVQPDYCHKYDDGGYQIALAAVTRGEPPRDLSEDETDFYPLDEQSHDGWTER